jgi:putative transposase
MSYTNLLYHIVFGTKGRLPIINEQLRPRFHQYLGGTIRGLGGIPLEIGGVEDHVHMLVKLKPTILLASLIRDLKSNSSVWAKANGISKFAWQRRYGAFTVSESQCKVVRKYIQNQQQHHR